VPWGALTPGVGKDLGCIPVTGQNIARLVIQLFMNYAPPDFATRKIVELVIAATFTAAHSPAFVGRVPRRRID
jgi:hypothetical protein